MVNTMVKLNLLLKEFADQHHLDEPIPNEKSIYHLTIDDMEVACFEKLGKGYFYSELMTLSVQKNTMPTVLKNLMNHSLARIKSQTCGLGLDADNNLILFERFDMDVMNLYDFSDLLERFVNALEEYRHFVVAEPTDHPATNTMIITP